MGSSASGYTAPAPTFEDDVRQFLEVAGALASASAKDDEDTEPPVTRARSNSWDLWARELYEKHLKKAGGDNVAANQ